MFIALIFVFALETEKTMSRGKVLVEGSEPLWREGQAGPDDPVIRVVVPPGGFRGLAADDLEALLDLEGPYDDAPVLMLSDPPLHPMGRGFRNRVQIIGPTTDGNKTLHGRRGRVIDGGQRTVDIGKRLPNGENGKKSHPIITLGFAAGTATPQVKTISHAGPNGTVQTNSSFKFPPDPRLGGFGDVIKVNDVIDGWAQFDESASRNVEIEEIWRGKTLRMNMKTLSMYGSKPEALYVQEDYAVDVDDDENSFLVRSFPAASLQIMHYGRAINKDTVAQRWRRGVIVDLGKEWETNKKWGGAQTKVTVMADRVEQGTPITEQVPIHQLLLGMPSTPLYQYVVEEKEE